MAGVRDGSAEVGFSQCMSEAEAREWGMAFSRTLAPGAVVALHGELGSGKTTLARAIFEGLGLADENAVTSPTFSIVQEYETPDGVVVHADLYRVRDPSEFTQLGWDELLAGARLSVVEWAEKYPFSIPHGAVHVHLAYDDACPDARRITWQPTRIANPRA